MGEYFYIANTCKKQFIHPHKLGEGLKRWELGARCMNALSYLLCTYNDNGWCNDPIIIVGDYAGYDPSQETIENTYEDITYAVVEQLCLNHQWFKEDLECNSWYIEGLRDAPKSLRKLLGLKP